MLFRTQIRIGKKTELYDTLDFIKPYRDHIPRRFFLICFFLSQSSQTKIFIFNMFSSCNVAFNNFKLQL